MALTRAYVRSFAGMNLDVGDILTCVNRMLASDLEDNRFATLLLARIDEPNRLLSYANAGHVPRFIVGGGERCRIDHGGRGPEPRAHLVRECRIRRQLPEPFLNQGRGKPNQGPNHSVQAPSRLVRRWIAL